MQLYDWQRATVDDAVKWLASSDGTRRLYAAPTGTGKSIIELALLAEVPHSWIVTPRVEIVAGMLSKLGCDVPASLDALVDLAFEHRITTPVRMRNAMLRGEWPRCNVVLCDESHHALADTYQQLDMLAGARWIGLTATPFRGTPRGTKAFLDQWGEPVWAITMREAVAAGYLAFPDCRVLPLVDDDVLEVQNGEFVVGAAGEATQSRLADVVEAARVWCDRDGQWDRPTIFALPNTETCVLLAEMLRDSGMMAYAVTQDTPYRDRQATFQQCLDCLAAIVQINVVSEGVDLAVRRLVDLAPTLSPVRWLQQLGRITRPGGESEYVCTNRNLLRHAYLLEGLLPAATYITAEQAFGGPGKRAGVRCVGLEALGRLKAVELPLASGITATCYAVAAAEGHVVTEYAVIAHPLREDVLWAKRDRTKADAAGRATYGRWQRCEPPADLRGFASVPGSTVTEKQAAWWKRSAARHGLDPTAKPNRKSFCALPVLNDLGVKL